MNTIKRLHYPKYFWKDELIVPNTCDDFECKYKQVKTDNFAEVVQHSMFIEALSDKFGNILIDTLDELRYFVISYGEFFSKEFISRIFKHFIDNLSGFDYNLVFYQV